MTILWLNEFRTTDFHFDSSKFLLGYIPYITQQNTRIDFNISLYLFLHHHCKKGRNKIEFLFSDYQFYIGIHINVFDFVFMYNSTKQNMFWVSIYIILN